MVATDRIRNDIGKAGMKIAEQRKQLHELEQKAVEEENLEVVRTVKAAKLDSKELPAFLRAYASGRISLPKDIQADLKEQEGSEDRE